MPSNSPYDIEALAHTVLMPGFAGTVAPDWILAAINDGLGGICYFGHNIDNAVQVAALSAQLHAAGPVLISVDEEGGIVTRLHAKVGSPHVGAAVLGRVDDPAVTGQVAALIAAEVRAAGIDIDLAPVADVNSNPANPVIGVRSFGADPAQVAVHTRAFVSAIQSYGVAACAKHFPGHGDTHVDSHIAVPIVEADIETLRAREFVPFVAAIDEGVRCIMTAHAVYNAIDDRPASLSAPTLSLLRNELGFDGVIISDAIDMQAISGTVGFGEGVVQALLAGVDLVALGNPVLGQDGAASDQEEFATALSAVLAAVESGRLSIDDLQRSAARIQALRDWGAGHDHGATGGSPAADDRAARDALRVRGNVSLRGPVHIVDVRRQRNVASGRLMSLLADELLARMPGSRAQSAFEFGAAHEGRVSDQEQERGLSIAGLEAPDVIVTGTPGQDPVETALLRSLLREHPSAVVVCLGWSGVGDDLGDATNAVFAFGDSRPSARAIAEVICR